MHAPVIALRLLYVCVALVFHRLNIVINRMLGTTTFRNWNCGGSESKWMQTATEFPVANLVIVSGTKSRKNVIFYFYFFMNKHYTHIVHDVTQMSSAQQIAVQQ